MVSLVINIRGENSFQLLYRTVSFGTGITVTGYLIYPDLTKSDVVSFNELGDGIYAAVFPYAKKTMQLDEKYGVVVKENGVVKHFEVVQVLN